MGADPFENAAELIADLGRCYARARRYRVLAAECEERYLARALAIGGDVREWARAAQPDRVACAAAVDELRRLHTACEAAIRGVHASASYAAAVRAWDAGRYDEVAALAPTIFDAVEPFAATVPLHFPVGLTARRGGEHFLPPAAVAERIVELMHTGLPAADPVPDLGADEHLRVVLLDESSEAIEAPVTLVVDPSDVSWPLFRLEPAAEVLTYMPRLQAPLRVHCAAEVGDEWWAVRPDAYARYVADLERELGARGVAGIERG